MIEVFKKTKKTLDNILTGSWGFVVNHPKSAALATLLGRCLTMQDGESVSVDDVFWPYLTYIGLSGWRDYVKNPKKKVIISSPDDASTHRKALSEVLNHPKPIALGIGTWAAIHLLKDQGLVEYLGETMQYYRESLDLDLLQKYFLRNLVGISLISEPVVRGWGYASMISNSVKEKKSILSKGYNLIFNHPFLVGLGAAGASWLDFEPLYSNPSEELINGFGYFCYGAIGSMFLGSFLHTNSLSYFKNSLLSKTCSVVGFGEKAIEYWKKVVDVPTSKQATIENKIHLAMLQGDLGKSKEAISTLREAAELFDEKEVMISHLDFLKSAFFRRRKLLTREYAVLRESSNRVMVYKGSKKAEDTFVFKWGNDKDSLDREFPTTEIVSELVSGRDVPIVRPITLLRGKDEYCLVTLRRKLKDLRNERFNFSRDADRLEKILDNVLVMQDVVTERVEEKNSSYVLSHDGKEVVLEKRDYKEEFLFRVCEGWGTDKTFRLKRPEILERNDKARDHYERFVNGSLELVRELEEKPFVVCNGDYNGNNVLSDGTIIDFGNACMCCGVDDVTSFVNDLDLEEHEERKLSNKYRERFGERTYYVSKFFNGMGYVGTTMSNNDLASAGKFLKHACVALVKLGKEDLLNDLRIYINETDMDYLFTSAQS